MIDQDWQDTAQQFSQFYINVNILTFSHYFNKMMSNKQTYRIPTTKSNKRNTRRINTQMNEPIISHKRQISRGSERNRSKQKYLHVYSKIKKQTNNPPNSNKKTFKISSKPITLNKHLKTQPDEQQRKTTVPNSTVNTIQNPQNKYQIDGIAGKGTFGTVYYGHVKTTGEKIAIKKVLQDKRYKNRQLQILKMIENPSVLQMRDHYMSTEGEKEYLNVVMDYFPYNLYQIIRKKQLPPPLIKIYLYQALRGLNYISSFDIAHRDIKPQNILIDYQRHRVVICDFGSAKQLVVGQSNLAYICSRCYRAPELIFGATNYTTQIDMWSLGCVLVEMINEQPPFIGDSQIDQLIEIIKILGTPSKQEVFDMNKKYDMDEYKKFPNLKKVQWKSILATTDIKLMDLVTKMLQYSPKKRLTPAQALLHPFFDELRDENSYKQLRETYKKLPQFFNFRKEQLSTSDELQKAIPRWYGKKMESRLSKKQPQKAT